MPLIVEFHETNDAVAGALRADDWRDDAFDFWAFDRRVDILDACNEPLCVIAAPDERASLRHQIELRTQRVCVARNHESRTQWFTRVLAEHAALHDVRKPLVRADLDHALDAWQWTLRLDPDATAVVQLAALLHDIERLASEADARVEHHAADYQSFKDAHARVGSNIARALLARSGAPAGVADDACALIATHERTSAWPQLAAVNDADALSFFSLNSPGYLSYFGEVQTAKKVAYTHARMSVAARGWLDGIRMPRYVRTCIAHDHLA
jgi:hypothetical protein